MKALILLCCLFALSAQAGPWKLVDRNKGVALSQLDMLSYRTLGSVGGACLEGDMATAFEELVVSVHSAKKVSYDSDGISFLVDDRVCTNEVPGTYPGDGDCLQWGTVTNTRLIPACDPNQAFFKIGKTESQEVRQAVELVKKSSKKLQNKFYVYTFVREAYDRTSAYLSLQFGTTKDEYGVLPTRSRVTLDLKPGLVVPPLAGQSFLLKAYLMDQNTFGSCLVTAGKSTNEVRLDCETTNQQFTFVLPSWALDSSKESGDTVVQKDQEKYAVLLRGSGQAAKSPLAYGSTAALWSSVLASDSENFCILGNVLSAFEDVSRCDDACDRSFKNISKDVSVKLFPRALGLDFQIEEEQCLKETCTGRDGEDCVCHKSEKIVTHKLVPSCKGLIH